MYDGGLKEISCVDKTGSILRLTEYSKDELETIIYVLLIYYLLGRGSPMPIFNEALSNITIDDEGNVGITKDSFRNADSLLFSGLEAVIQNQRLSHIIYEYRDFYSNFINAHLNNE